MEAWCGPFCGIGGVSDIHGQQKTPRAEERERFDNSDMWLLPLHKKKEGGRCIHRLTLYRQFVLVANKTGSRDDSPLP